MKNELELKPTYWASISGGKDSLFMLKLILKHPEKYPLNGVVYFDLEIDYPFIKDVIDKIKAECIRLQIPMFCVKPEKTWIELYNTNKYPSGKARWCNSRYKLSCQRKFDEMQRQYGNSVNWYIGYCYDEKSRYEKRKKTNEIYPLVDYEIEEKYILDWAKNQKIYNNYYKVCNRCGCVFCPLTSLMTKAYLLKYYPEIYNKMIYYMIDTEISMECKSGKIYSAYHGKYDTAYLDRIVKTKWLPKLEKELEIYEN